MSIFDLSVEERLWYYVGMLHSGDGLWMWYFSEDGTLYHTTCPYEQELKVFLTDGDCMEYVRNMKEKEQKPFLVSDTIGMYWVGEYVEVKEKRLFLIGPVFHAGLSVRTLEDAVRKRNLSIQMYRNCMRVLQEVPVVNRKMMISYARMLHYMITLEDARYIPVQFPKEEKKQETSETESGIDYERMRNQEQLLLQCVRDGNRNYEKVLDKISVAGSDQLATGEPLRDAVNIVVIFISKCAQAAVEGGLPGKTAMEMERFYLKEAGRKKSVQELMELNMRMLEDFIGKVQEGQRRYGVSKPVQDCCHYIREHLTEKLTLKDLAEETGYTEYYLTRKFQKETGKKLSEYIRETRLEYAKILLATTNKNIEEISEGLHLGTRSYFGRVFKDATGMTPAAYREHILGRSPKQGEDIKQQT